MSKELEAFRDILGILSAVSGCEVDMNSERIISVKSALQRLEAIDNANPSEALECLKEILNKAYGYGVQSTLDNLLLRGYNTKNMLEQEYFGNTLTKDLDENRKWLSNLNSEIIKQALIKSQEQEKVLEIIFKYRINVGLFHTLVILCRNSYKTCKEENKFVGSNIADNEFPTEEEFDLLKRWLDE